MKKLVRMFATAAVLVAAVAGTALGDPASDLNRELTPFIERSEWREVLRVGRAKLADPQYRDRGARGFAKLAIMRALSEIAAQEGGHERNDAEVLRYYSELRDLTRRADNRAQIERIMYRYYSNTYRTGLGVRHQLESYRLQKSVGSPILLMGDEMLLAQGYMTFGDLASAGAYYQLGLARARAHFSRPVVELDGISPKIQWDTYDDALQHYQIYAQMRGDRAQVLWAWRERQRAFAYRYPRSAADFNNGDTWSSRAGTALVLAEMGHEDEARRVYAPVRLLFTTQMPPQLRLRDAALVDCFDQLMELELGNPPEVQAVRRCTAYFNAPGSPRRGVARPNSEGELAEAVGDEVAALRLFEKSVGETERLRTSFPASARAGALSFNSFIAGYHGVLRIRARRAIQSGSDADFARVLEAADATRARHLADATEQSGAFNDYLTSVRAPHAGVTTISISSTTRGTVVAAFSSKGRRIKLIPESGRSLAARVQAVSAALADPGSAQGDLETRIQKLSADYLGGIDAVIEEGDRIVIAIEGPFAFLPFGVLSVSPSYMPIGLAHDITLRPSLRVVTAPPPAPSRRALVAVADPVYPTRIVPDEFTGLDFTSAARSRGVRGARGDVVIPPLPETRSETQAIAALFSSSHVQLLMGDKATEGRLKAMDLREAAYLHIATHGVLGGEIPGLEEPALVLGRENREDSFLRASEVRGMKLQGATVTLSACNTGNGTFLGGEGVMAMSEAFLRAGARDVVASLWLVDSAETERLMVDFYRAHLSGAPVATALRQAMILARERRSHPYYWAAFEQISAFQ